MYNIYIDLEGGNNNHPPYSISYVVAIGDTIVKEYNYIILEGMENPSKTTISKIDNIEGTENHRIVLYKSFIASIRRNIKLYNIKEIYSYGARFDIGSLNNANLYYNLPKFTTQLKLWGATFKDVIPKVKQKYKGLENYKLETVCKSLYPNYKQQHTAYQDVVDMIGVL